MTVSGSVDRAQIKAYLDLIYPPEYGWRGLISASHSLPSGTGMPSGRWPRDSAVDGIAELAESGARRGAPGVYLRCSTVRPDLAAGRRGGAGDSVELPGLWADLDIDGPGHRHDPERHGGRVLAKDPDQAAQIVTAAGLPAPTLWVHSGGGLYAWWLFGERVELGLEPAWQRISEAWQGRLHEGAKSLGLHYGPVGNLDRVLGVVGTVNAKVQGDPRMRRLLTDPSHPGPRYAPGELARLVMTEGPTAGIGPSGASDGVGPLATGAAPQAPTPGPLAASSLQPDGHLSPLDDFERRHSWGQILFPLGWELVGGVEGQGPCEWRRPGASHPLSATTGRDPARDRMWVFSDAAGLPTDEPLTKGYVYAQLWHGGDLSAAARAVQAIGYGTVIRKGEGQAGSGDLQQGVQPRHLELVPASSMGGPRASRWLWAEDGAHWLPLGGLALLGGREGRGKTTWTYRLIALLTRGSLPGDLRDGPRSAVIAATEDAWRETIIPRLMAAGADLDRVHRIDAVEPDRRTGVSLPDDLDALRTLLAGRPEVALLVLDPIMTVLSARLDSHKDHEVRKALEPISDLAHQLGITVLGLIHDNKSTGTDLSTRLMGSRAFVAVARAALVCTEEPDEPDESTCDGAGADPVEPSAATEPVNAAELAASPTFLLGQVKNNLQAKVGWTIRYRIGGRVVAHDDEYGKDIEGSHVIRLGRHLVGLDERMRAAEKARPSGDGAVALKAARAAILAALAGGERASFGVKANLTEQGHSGSSVDRACRELVAEGLVLVRRQGRGTVWVMSTEGPTSLSDVDDVSDVSTSMTYDVSHRSFSEGASFAEAGLTSTSTTSPLPARDVSPADVSPMPPCSCPRGPGGILHAPWCRGGRAETA